MHFEGDQAAGMVEGPLYGGVSSPAVGELMVNEALKQNRLMGHIGQLSIIAIQYLQFQL